MMKEKVKPSKPRGSLGYVLILGAKSDIAKAVAKEYASRGYDLYLAARKPEQIKAFASDLSLRQQNKVRCLEFDVLNDKSHGLFYQRLKKKPVGVILAVGYLGEQRTAQTDFKEARKIIDTNYTGVVNLLHIIADDFEKRKHGFIVGISSVAGDRGRKGNYVYGSAKAGLTTYLSGLRNRLFSSNVHVLTVKPGFVATQMTRGMKLSARLTAQPEEIASAIYQAQQKKKNEVYLKWIWRWIMIIIKSIPEWKFKRMNL